MSATPRPTPGPWYLGIACDFNVEKRHVSPTYQSPGYYENVAIKNDTTDVVGCDEYDVFGGDPDERIANINLIVAACNACQTVNPENPVACAEAIPDLIAALKDCLEGAEMEWKSGGVSHIDEQMVRSALAKAEGRPE